ncbi:PQQ-dependent sugar dehydrogenase [Wenzhouxiangella marina]|uniref:Glucose/sorbosone dehydrogenase-like protein n=1 Tax=Wenzhouxiangella marina TaxID=1579979 RepID=A0A0K0Y0A3_9GAMM|nr:PQQ-dependent sugar dehydrogenase [Wenzhouxiangella marina]AKS43317.1 Glucose/sorbosone dehydrogenase-like protein [Wenzhouxiangella marina]MBB6088567.1 glucose/arabinose dehydrogenase [Wenzhouxiangella marina]
MSPKQLIALLALSLPALGLAQIPGDITLDTAFGGASFPGPVAIRHAGDGSDRKFVVQLNGQIRIVDASDNVLATPFLNVDSLTFTNGERGLLGLAFHPNYASNGLIYINHSADNIAGVPDGDTVIAEYQVSAGDPNVIDPASRRQILVVAQDFSNHNGGDLHFGPDGYLYIGMGDGGSGNDPCNRGQTLDPATTPPAGPGCRTGENPWLLGKMIRIDVDNTTPAGANNLCAANPDGSAEYAIPADNPFVGQANRCGEVWSYGLRNPFRFSFDRDTGDMWIADVGQNNWEEVDFEPAGTPGGRNYGWKICEGTYVRGSQSTTCTLPGHTPPVLEYNHNAGECSITGGYRYRGPVTSMQGYYVYADFCSSRVWFASETGPGTFTSELFGQAFSNPIGFGEDEAGNLYVGVSSTGQILVFNGDTPPGDPIFQDRFEDGAP